MILMTLDASTLTFAGALVALTSGLFVLMHWWSVREDRAALAWGAASCAMGVGIAMLALHSALPSVFSTVVGPLLLDICAAWMWAATRIFNRGKVAWRPLLIGVAAWLAILAGVGASGLDWLAATLGLVISASLYAAGAFEFWRARAERLGGRWAMVSILALEAISLFLAGAEVCIYRNPLQTPSVGGFGLIHFVGLVYSGGGAVFLVTMLKDRSQTRYKAAALVDPLTGLANRRAFLERSQVLLDQSLRSQVPFSLLAFDLDRFKGINDTFGHPVGDQVLRIFADTVSKASRSADIAGRIGGEEFALALPGCGVEAALHVARRIRAAFQDDAHFVNGQPVDGTVCVGVATAPEHGSSVAEVIASADRALYRAKDAGRNRVMLAVSRSADPDPANVIRIA
jgi:diguanylate cyclase (GGDEF)-like protein